MRLYKVLLVVALAAEGGGFVARGRPATTWSPAAPWWPGSASCSCPRAGPADEPDPGPAVPDLRHFLKRFDEWCLVAPPLTTEIQEGRWIRLVGAVNLLRSGTPPATRRRTPRRSRRRSSARGAGRRRRAGPCRGTRSSGTMQMAETLRFALTGRCRSCAAKEGVRDARG
jgi:hypothetical protein